MRTPIIQESFFDKLSASPPKKKRLILLVSSLLVFLLIWGVEGSFQGSKLRRAVYREQTLKESYENQFRQYAKLTHMRKQSFVMQAQLKQMLLRLPTQSQMHIVLKNITKMGHEAGVSFVFFKPQPEKDHDFYADLEIKITVLGNYHQMATFLSHIANMKQLATVHDFEIIRENPKKNILTMRATVKVYHQIQELNGGEKK